MSDKAVSKWETGHGLPDITLIEPLARTLRISVAELLSGDIADNRNVSADMRRSCVYICPLCGNVVTSIGATAVSCHGIQLPPLEAEKPDPARTPLVEKNDGSLFVSMEHEMSKQHHISFMTLLTSDTVQIRKLYPEQSAEARFALNGPSTLLIYCNHHGLFSQRIFRL